MAAQIERGRVAQARCDRLRRADGHRCQRRRRHAHDRHQQQVDGVEQALDLALHAGAQQQQPRMVERGKPAPEIEQGGELRPVLRAPRRKGRLVSKRRLDAAHWQPLHCRLVELGQRHVHRHSTGFAQHRRCALECAPRVGVQADQVAGQAEPLARHASIDRAGIVVDGTGRCGGIVGIGAGDHAQHHGGVARAARHRPDMVERFGEREHARPAHPPPRGLQAGEAVHRGRKTDRAAGVGAQRRKAQARRGRHARAGRRDAGPVGGVPGIDRRGDRRVVDAVGALGHLQLAQDDRAGALQARHDRRILRRHMAAVDRHAGGRRDALGIAQILDRDRHAVQRAARGARGGLGVETRRVGQRTVSGQCREAPEPAIDPGDAIEHRSRQFDGRELARLQAPRDLVERQVVQIDRHARALTGPYPSPGYVRRDNAAAQAPASRDPHRARWRRW